MSELTVLQEEVSKCVKCTALKNTRTQTVFGIGNPNADLLFLGEAPGREEDKQGVPFVGRAGELLDNIIKACEWSREDVYICNIIKCRPPENRNPYEQEAKNCRSFLDQQIELVKPKIIVCLGKVAINYLLGKDMTIPVGVSRGSWHKYNGIKVRSTYHPAYLLRNPDAKKDTWEDMKNVIGEWNRI